MKRRALWAAWRLLPPPLRGPAHGVVAAVRRGRARSTPLPSEPGPPLPAVALELPTRYGSFWFDGTDEKIVPWIRRHGTWEADVVRLLGRSVRPGATVVDVGANVGFHAVLLSKLVGPTGAVHAFEPMPETVELLRANIWRHGCTNTAVHPSAVADRTGTVLLEHDPAGSSGARLAASGIAVGAVTLDGVLGSTRVDILKVDVEGAEPLVLRGAAQVLAASPGLLAVVEFRAAPHADGSAPEDVLELYRELGFELCVLRPEGIAVPADATAILAVAARVETLNIVLRRRDSAFEGAVPDAG